MPDSANTAAHRVDVEWNGSHGDLPFHAYCLYPFSCGWRGRSRATAEEARADGAGHLNPLMTLPPISDEQRAREAMGVYDPVYPQHNDGSAE